MGGVLIVTLELEWGKHQAKPHVSWKPHSRKHFQAWINKHAVDKILISLCWDLDILQEWRTCTFGKPIPPPPFLCLMSCWEWCVDRVDWECVSEITSKEDLGMAYWEEDGGCPGASWDHPKGEKKMEGFDRRRARKKANTERECGVTRVSIWVRQDQNKPMGFHSDLEVHQRAFVKQKGEMCCGLCSKILLCCVTEPQRG